MKTRLLRRHMLYTLAVAVCLETWTSVQAQTLLNSASPDGTVVVWGDNVYSQTNVPVDLSGVTAISAGGNHTAALKTNGIVVAWGYDNYGQSTVPPGLSGVAAIAAGDYHTVALKTNGSAVAWGYDYYGQSTVPAGLSNIVAISAGGFYTVVLKQDGTVVAWGHNDGGQTNVPAGLSNVVAISAGYSHSVALTRDGTVVSWGANNSVQMAVPADLSNVVAIAAGGDHTVALKRDGTVVAWGYSGDGQLDVPAGLSNVVAIAAGGHHAVALKQDGMVVAWGLNNHGQRIVPSGLIGAVAIAAGGFHTAVVVVGLPPSIATHPQSRTVNLRQSASLSVTATGTGPLSYQWFRDTMELPAATNAILALNNVQTNQAGGYRVVITNAYGSVTSSVARLTVNSTDSRTVVAWGNNEKGQSTVPSGLSGVIAISAGYFHTLALKQEGTVVAWGWNMYGQTNVPMGLSNVMAISAGGSQNVALKQDGTVVAWEYNMDGESTVPAELSGVVAIAAGGSHNVALKQDGTVVAWGWNVYGQTDVPTGLSNVVAIAAGSEHTVALKQDGKVVAWGWNADGQCTVPANLNDVVSVAAGRAYSVALKQDGTVVVWGWNGNGVTNVPAGLSKVVAIAAGGAHIVALKEDGMIVGWGSNWAGQNNVPAGLSGVVAISAGDGHTVVIGLLRPSITTHPASRTVNVGQSAVFSVMTAGGGTLSFQWLKNGTNIPNATNANYTIPAVADSDAGNYSVVVMNSAGSVTSADAVLTVLDTPAFTSHPLTQTVGVGNNVTFSATAYGAAPLVFQWYFNGSPVSSPTTGTNVSFLTLTNVQTNKSGSYHVQVFNGYGSATSSDAALSVVVFPPSIAIQPSNQNPLLGESASFTVSVNGTPPYRYQWQFNGTDIPRATNATYTILAVAESDGGNYSVVVANSAGNVTSDNATLTVLVPPKLRLQMLVGYPLLSLHGMLGSNFNVQYVTSLAATNWVNLRTIPNLSATPFQFLDTAGNTSPARYYRAIMR